MARLSAVSPKELPLQPARRGPVLFHAHALHITSGPSLTAANQTLFDRAAREFSVTDTPRVPLNHLKWIEDAENNPDKYPEGVLCATPLFNIAVMRRLLEHHNTELRDRLYELFKHADFHPRYGLSLSEERAHVMKMWKRVAALGFMQNSLSAGTVEGRQRYDAVIESCGMLSHSLDIKMSVHYGLFGATIKLMGDDEQAARWMPLVERCEMLGCFALTELGHGSNARAVETIAKYQPSSRTFTIHTPTDSAQKYWIGGAFQTARWTVCFAQLTVGSVCHGVHPFLVRIRNDDGRVAKGITLADCGHKCGLNGVDNGRIWFDNVSVRLDYMLRRYSQVSPDGVYTSQFSSADERFGASLASLSGGRISVAAGCLNQAKIGLTIAIRYALSRRAFGPRNGEEVRLLDYQSHQYRLIPALATTYSMQVVLNDLHDKWHRQELGKQLHVWSCGFKALMTWHSLATLQEAREACGGQGYKSENRIGPMKNGHDVAVTYEGDNHILLQAVTKTVLPEFLRGVRNGAFQGHFAYLNERGALQAADLSVMDARSLEYAEIVFRRREGAVFSKLAKQLGRMREGGMSALDAFNNSAMVVEEAARAHTEVIMLQLLQRRLKLLDAEGQDDIVRALQMCATLYSLKCMDSSTVFVRSGALPAGQADRVHDLVLVCCKEMRAYVLDFVKAFGIAAHLLAPIAFDYVGHNSRGRL